MAERVVAWTEAGEPLVQLRRVPSRTEGQIVQGLLRTVGVESVLVGGESAGYGAGSSPMNRLRLLVTQADLEFAREVLAAPPEEPLA